MERAEHNRILGEINTFLNSCPPPLPLGEVGRKCSMLLPPNLFYYQHLDERLTLKNVALMKNLVTGLSATVDRTLESIKEKDIVLSHTLESGYIDEPLEHWEPLFDAECVAQEYQCLTGERCALIASMLFLSPRSPKWKEVISMGQFEWTMRYYPATEGGYALGVQDHGDWDEVWDHVDKDTCRALRNSERPKLALWEVFGIIPEAEAVLKNMGELPTNFTYCEHAIAKPNSSPIRLPCPPDAESTSWGELLAAFLNISPIPDNVSSLDVQLPPKRRVPQTTNVKSRSTAKAKRGQLIVDDNHSTGGQGIAKESWKSVEIPHPSEMDWDGAPMTTAIVLNAWLRSVHADTTFTIFNCGNLERIGIRHRRSQTLYLSDLIDVPNCKDPGYGKIHVGLYMSIIHDLLDRISQEPEPSVKPETTRKRWREEDVDSPVAKRPKTRATVAKELVEEAEKLEAYEILTNTIPCRSLALIQMRYGVYNSPAPMYFLRDDLLGRPDKTKIYESHEYIVLTLTSEITADATGAVHSATLELLTEDGMLRTIPAVVKLAFEREKQMRLLQEAIVYNQLEQAGVQGVPRVFGFFKDVASGVRALVMAHVGTSLRRLCCLRGLEPAIPEPKRSAFLNIMKSIHSTGIRHRDITPENLTIDDEGNVFIIDFDLAEFESAASAREQELAHLEQILDGDHNCGPPWSPPSEQMPDLDDYETDSAYSSSSDDIREMVRRKLRHKLSL